MERQLFGGAITCHIPANWTDVANIRQVPDHQECWQDDDRLFVVEILEYRGDIVDSNAGAFFFEDLAESNETVERTFVPLTAPFQIVGLPSSASLCFASGFQRVAMGRQFDVAGHRRQQDVRGIRVELCAIRLPSITTDLLITLSTPCEWNPQESELAMTNVFQQAMSTLRIRDWTLFG